MPLPADTTLALQVPSNHGDPIQAKGKKAMIVRMSAETLEALENELNAQLDVEFSDRPVCPKLRAVGYGADSARYRAFILAKGSTPCAR